MVNELGSHHILGVEGDYIEELKYLCNLYGIEPMFFQRIEEEPDARRDIVKWG